MNIINIINILNIYKYNKIICVHTYIYIQRVHMWWFGLVVLVWEIEVFCV
jgi:hypothetical protein